MLLERRLIPKNPAVFNSPQASSGIDLIPKPDGKMLVEYKVPFVQEEVDKIAAFRNDLNKLHARSLGGISSLRDHTFPSGKTFMNRELAITTMWETAEAIEKVLAQNNEFEEKLNYTMIALQGQIGEVSVKSRLEDMVTFVYETYGRPVDVKKFLEHWLYDVSSEELAKGVPKHILERYGSVGEVLKFAREKKEINGFTLAKTLGWRPARVSEIERGSVPPVLENVAAYLQEIGDILPHKEYLSPLARIAILKAREYREVRQNERRSRAV